MKSILIIISLFFSYLVVSQEVNHDSRVESLENKQFVFYTYGFPRPFNEARATVLRKWGIRYESIAGCVIDHTIEQKAATQNKKTREALVAYYGKDWESRLEHEITHLKAQ